MDHYHGFNLISRLAIFTTSGGVWVVTPDRGSFLYTRDEVEHVVLQGAP